MTPSNPTLGQKSDKETDIVSYVKNFEFVPTEKCDMTDQKKKNNRLGEKQHSENNAQPNNCWAISTEDIQGILLLHLDKEIDQT